MFQIHVGTISQVGTCPGIVECDFDLMWNDAPGLYGVVGTVTAFADGTPLRDVITDGSGDWRLSLGTFSDDFNPNGPEGFFNGRITINRVVPVPAAVWLRAPASLGLVGLRRRSS